MFELSLAVPASLSAVEKNSSSVPARAEGIWSLPFASSSASFEPAKERGADIEAEEFEIVDGLDPFSGGARNPNSGVGEITFVEDPLVPVVEGFGVGLNFNFIRPRIFPGGLVEMTVKGQVGDFGR